MDFFASLIFIIILYIFIIIINNHFSAFLSKILHLHHVLLLQLLHAIRLDKLLLKSKSINHNALSTESRFSNNTQIRPFDLHILQKVIMWYACQTFTTSDYT